MIPPSFDYHVPNSVNDAIGMLKSTARKQRYCRAG